ncbi:hypothetical protein N7G274_000855 [Stereocaulon virgatum]|uniref:Myb-like domain-containing protein n=1 Tax=Stereocaulon virgatum TaxID=373712 RepID=A0ABR4AM75_9LECA
MALYQNITSEEELKHAAKKLSEREDNLAARANRHVHAQEVPPCTYAQGGQHNINCDRGLDASILQYHYFVSKGLIRVKDYEEWGCMSREEELHHRDIANTRVRMAFRSVNWDKGFTGRGMGEVSLNTTDTVGPSGEIESSGMSPLELNGVSFERSGRSGGLGTSVANTISNVDEHTSHRRSKVLNGDEADFFAEGVVDEQVSALGGLSNDEDVFQGWEKRGASNIGRSGERDDEKEVGLIDEFTLQADVTRQMMNALDDILSEVPSKSTLKSEAAPTEALAREAAHALLDESETTPTIGTKRARDNSLDSGDKDSDIDESVSRSKRRCTSQIERTKTFGPVRNNMEDVAKGGPKHLNNTEDATTVASPQASKKRDRDTFEATESGEDGSVSESSANNKRVRRSEQREIASSEAVNNLVNQVRSRGSQRSPASTTTTTSNSDASTGNAEKAGAADTCDSSFSNVGNDGPSNHDTEPVIHIIQIKVEEDEDRTNVDEIKGTPPVSVRPTYEGLRWERDANGAVTQKVVPERNEADEIVVMNVQGKEGRLPCIHQPDPYEPWTAEDDEKLRSSVQDYDIEDWLNIAWCLRRQVDDCKQRYCEIVADRNMRWGRNPRAGLPRNLIAFTASQPPQEALDAAPAQSNTPLAPGPAAAQAPARAIAQTQAVLPALPTPPPAAKSNRVLRPRTQHAVPRFQCGNIVYDPKAKSLPKVSKKGTIVDNKGNVILGTEGEVRMALKNKQPRRKAGAKLVLNANPNFYEDAENAPTSSVLRVRGTGVAKRNGRKGGQGQRVDP